MAKMNLDTLIEAANFVEHQEVHPNGAFTRESKKHVKEERDLYGSSTVLPHSPPLEKRVYHTSMWVRSNGESPYSRNSTDEDFQDLRRRPGAREVHNKLEKHRRAHLKECFELVKKQLPASQVDKKASNLTILHNAIRYIQILRRKDRDYEQGMERLAREKIALQQRFANLKKELSAEWDHIDFNSIIPEAATSDHEEATQSTSSLSSAATASASPHLPHHIGDERNSPNPKVIPSDAPKLISFTSRLEPTKRPAQSTQLQLPVLTNASSGHLAATLVSPIQLMTSSNLRVLPEEASLGFRLSQATPHATSGMAVMQKAGGEDTLGLVPSGVHGSINRGKAPLLAIPGLTANNNFPAHLASGFTHVVTSLAGPHGTLVTPVPVTMVSQGSQVAHILTAAPGKVTQVMTPLSIKPIPSQYLVKPGVVVVSQI